MARAEACFALKRRGVWRREDLFCNDTLRVDTQGATCSIDLLCPNTATRNPFAPRAHHSATVVGEELWLIGGCDKRYASGPESLSCISTRATERNDLWLTRLSPPRRQHDDA